MKQITENWLYMFDRDKKTNEIVVGDNLDVIILDFNSEHELKRNIKVGKNSKLTYRFLAFKSADFDVNIEFKDDNAKWDIKYLLMSKDNLPVRWTIDNKIHGENIKVDIDITSLVWENGEVNADWNIFIDFGSKQIEWNLNKQSIFLWNEWKSDLSPRLEINSNDVVASHGAKIERLDKEKIFYVMSKWITFDDAKKSMIWWYINSFFDDIEDQDEFRDELVWYLV